MEMPAGSKRHDVYAKGAPLPPLVSVIVSNFNYETFLIACLNSIVAQDYPNFECLVVDDASTDGSVATFAAWHEKAQPKQRVELVQRADNGGQMAALKSGLAEAHGRFLAFIDADDLLLPDFLSAHLHAHLELPAVALTACGFRLIDADARLIGSKDTLASRQEAPLYVPSQLIWRSPWWWTAMSGAVFRRSAVELMVTDKDEGFIAGADNYLCQAANLLGGSLLLPGHHAAYRHHGDNNYGYLEIFGQSKRRPPRKKRKRHDTPSEIRRHLLLNRERLLAAISISHYQRMLINATPPRVAWHWLWGGEPGASHLTRAERRMLFRQCLRTALLKQRGDRVLSLEGRQVSLKDAPR